MKKLFLIFTLLILLSSFANASLEADWLLSRSTYNKWNTIEETAYAVLALKTESTKYSSQISKAIPILKTNLDNCISTNSCNVKEAALSILAMKDSVANLDIYTTWLLNSRSIQYSGELTGWKVQIISPTKLGSCILNNTEIQQYQIISVNTGYTPWQDISSAVLTSNTKTLELDCSSLQATDLILSLIQEKLDQGITYYYIKQEEHNQQKITVEFGNPCWGSSYRSSCDKDTTSLVLYAFKQLNKPADSTWLKQQSLTPLQNAFLYKITQDQKYLDAVKLAQTTVGDWDQDVYQTAMITYLLKPSTFLDKSYSWINSNKNPQNCWPLLSCKVITTSAVLMSQAVTQITIIDTDNDGIDDNWETTYCNGNCDPNADPDKDGLTNLQEYKNGTDPNKADTDGDKYTDKQEVDAKTNPNDINDYPIKKGEEEEEKDSDGDGYTDKEERIAGTNPLDSSDYPGSEPGGIIEDHIPGEVCKTDVGCDGKYNLFEVCEDIPGDSCPFSDTTVDAAAKQPAKEPEEGRSTLFWFLIVLLLLIILIGGGFLAYKKGLLKFKFGKKPSKPVFPTYIPKLKPIPKTQYKPVMKPAQHKSPFRKHIEESLEKSMKEMEDLLKK